MNFNDLLQIFKVFINRYLRFFLLVSGLISINYAYAAERESECPELYVKYYAGNICHWEMAAQALAYQSPREDDCDAGHERVAGYCVKNFTELTMNKGMALLKESEDKNCEDGEWLRSGSSICLKNTLVYVFDANTINTYSVLIDMNSASIYACASGSKLELWSGSRVETRSGSRIEPWYCIPQPKSPTAFHTCEDPNTVLDGLNGRFGHQVFLTCP